MLFRSGTSQTLHSAIRTGYDFKGWHETNDYKQGDKRLTQVNRDLAEDTTYFAHWTLKRITVTFDVNLASAFPDKVDRTVVDYGSLINFPQLSDNFGIYEFIGWNTRRDGSGDYLRNGQEFNREVTTTLYAQWREL